MSVQIPISKTKVVVPRRRNEWISRSRLLVALDELLDYKLLIVAAPAGYGKTSLLIDYAAQTSIPITWYALDELDQDPQRFAAHLIASIQTRFPDFGAASMAALQNSRPDQADLDSWATTLANDVYEHIGEHFAIVLDDYHLVASSQGVDRFLNRFIQEVDENCHLVLASRSLLTLPVLPLMVARSQVGGLSFEELVFSPDEIKQLFAANYNRKLGDDEAEEIFQQSEGWITGLLLSSQLSTFDADARLRIARVSGIGLYEYLAQQVLEQQPGDIQQFLLWSSFLGEFDAALCRVVLEPALGLSNADWQGWIQAVLQKNLFVLPVGDEQFFLRYHHLFQDFLQKRLLRDRPAQVTAILCRRAEVHRGRAEWEQAYAIYQRLQDEQNVAGLVELAGMDLIISGRSALLAEWLNAVPPSLIASRTALTSLQGSVYVMQGKTEQGLVLLNLAIQAMVPGQQAELRLQTLLRRASTYRQMGHYQMAVEDADAVLRETQSRPEFNRYRAEGLRVRGTLQFYQGQLADARAELNQALSMYQEAGDGESAARVLVELGMAENNLGNPAAAEQAYTQALRFWQKKENGVWQANLLNNLGVLKHQQGEYEAASGYFEEAIHQAHQAAYPRLEGYALASIGDVYRDLDSAQSARQAYEQARRIAQQTKDHVLLFYSYIGEAVLDRQRKRFQPARAGLDRAARLADESKSAMERQRVFLESGALRLAQGDFTGAAGELKPAIVKFEQAGARMDAARAYLYFGLIQLEQQDYPAAAESSQRIAQMLPDDTRRQALVVSSLEFKELVERGAQAGLPVLTWLDQQAAEFAATSQLLRRKLRSRATSVPIGPPRLVITALGKAEVRINDRTLAIADWKTQLSRDLFFLFLAHPEGLTKEQVGEIFWPDSSPAELKLRFKNSVYRLRHAVGSDAISFVDEIYRFNPALDYEYDVESFQKELALARETASMPERIEHYRQAANLYRGDFLPGLDDTWVITDRERLRSQAIDATLRLANLLAENQQYDEALAACGIVNRTDPCQEDAHRLSMKVYSLMGNRAGIVRQYEACRSSLLEDVGVEPSPQTQQLFKELMR